MIKGDAWRCLKSRSVADNKLYYGDNLDVLRRYVRDKSVNLIYLDPPFNTVRITTSSSPKRTAPVLPRRSGL